MQTKPKSNSVITHGVAGSVPGRDVVISFNVAGAGMVELRTSKLHVDVINQASVHGLIQRISDAAAISRNSDTGQPATPAEKLAAMRALVEHYESGTAEWARRGAGQESLLMRCLQEAYPAKSIEELQIFIDARSSAEQRKLLVSDKLRPIAERLRGGSGDAATGDKLLGELG